MFSRLDALQTHFAALVRRSRQRRYRGERAPVDKDVSAQRLAGRIFKPH